MGEQSVKEFYQKQIQEAENKKVLVEKEIDDVKRKCRILRDNIRRIRTELLKEISTVPTAEIMREMIYFAENAEHE